MPRAFRSQEEWLASIHCGFCGAKPSDDTKLIPGPRCCVCFACVPRLRREGEALLQKGLGGIQRRPTGEELPCSFCDKAGVKWMVQRSDARICDECVALCERILAEPE